MMNVQLAGFGGVVLRVRPVACGRVRMVCGGFVIAFFIMFGSFAMVTGGLLVVIGGMMMMFARGMLMRHFYLRFVGAVLEA